MFGRRQAARSAHAARSARWTRSPIVTAATTRQSPEGEMPQGAGATATRATARDHAGLQWTVRPRSRACGGRTDGLLA
eukprot:scaffold68854_cov70-Phaeocystis_antarctica.AAC.8